MNKHIIEDARRCLQCKTPLCALGCPVHTPIKEAIALLLESRIEEAGALLFENNPLSLVCCHVCPQENQCEGHCALGRATDMPVHISAIEQYISDFYLSLLKIAPSDKTAGKVAIIGSGPAGITLSFLLARKNYDITIFEGNPHIGGILRYGIPDFRLPNNVLERLKQALLQSGVHIRPNTTIGASLTVDELFRDGYQAIFIGTGVWRPRKLGIKGESLGNVHFAIEYLRSPEAYDLGRRLVIIGAGNVAMDVARTAIRHGTRDVTVVFNREEAEMSARKTEVDFAKIDGVKFLFGKSVVSFEERGALLADSRVTEADGKRQVIPVPGTEQLYEADSCIVAVSQGPRAVIVSSTTGIEVAESGLVATDQVGRTTRRGVFASGDVVTGAKTVVEAVRVSKMVADAIDAYVQRGEWKSED